MGILDEAPLARTQLESALDAGIDSLSLNQKVLFTQYVKSTLPTDGYVFWVATGTTAEFIGSLHYISDRQQEEDQTLTANRFLFTAEQEVSALNSISPNTLWVGTWQVDGTTLQVVFSSRGSFYAQANIWHYSGYAVYPAMASQLVNSAADLPLEPIVSNSLPIWLSQNSFCPVYPSYLVPDNISPPYITAHVEPQSTTALGSFPIYTWPGTVIPSSDPEPLQAVPSSQLMQDKVRLTLYGFTNQKAIQYYASLIDYSVNTDAFGFCNSPGIMDDKRTQPEIAAIAMKKTIDIVASYYQSTTDAIAKRLIISSTVTSNV